MEKKLLERFMKKNCKSQIKRSLQLKEQLREKVISYFANGEVIIILLTVGLMKKIVI